VQSKKGPEGGYYLARSARQINVGEVVRFLDGPIAPIQCVSRTLGEKCEIGGRCGFFPLWKRVRDAVAEIVDHTTVADVVEEQEREAAAGAKVFMYHI
jgi:Rrf2 family protein